jgi:hypothetical protein
MHPIPEIDQRMSIEIDITYQSVIDYLDDKLQRQFKRMPAQESQGQIEF